MHGYAMVSFLVVVLVPYYCAVHYLLRYVKQRPYTGIQYRYIRYRYRRAITTVLMTVVVAQPIIRVNVCQGSLLLTVL